MVTIRQITLLPILVALSLSPSSVCARPASSKSAHTELSSNSSLFEQSAAQALANNFPSHDISFLLLDAHTGRVLASRWDNPDSPIPMGSLLKPFTVVAYGEQHNYQYPGHTCRGTPTGCWLPRGHGDVDLTSAIAHSCNSYFRMLTENLNAADVSPTAIRSASSLRPLKRHVRNSPVSVLAGGLRLCASLAAISNWFTSVSNRE